MDVIEAKTFESLLNEIKKITNKFGIDSIHSIPFSLEFSIYFRGQEDFSWDLKTTLQRSSSIDSMEDYLDYCGLVQPVIETEMQTGFTPMVSDEVTDWLKSKDDYAIDRLKWFDYLYYLRHHGFPSPLLDWTRSLYIALGFAFFSDSKTSQRSIYMFVTSQAANTLENMLGSSKISICGNHVKTSKRHFLQQAAYTLAYKREVNDYKFDLFENVLTERRNGYLFKFSIPSAERINILHYLFSVNITPYSIMPSEENFIKTLWIREVEFLRNKYFKKPQAT
jgi:hypothetical protein